MRKDYRKFYKLIDKHVQFEFYKFTDLVRYIKVYPNSRITSHYATKKYKRASVVLLNKNVYGFNCTRKQLKILTLNFKDIKVMPKTGLSKFQRKAYLKKFVINFNSKNYFQQQKYIKFKALSFMRSDSAFASEAIKEPLEKYVDQVLKELKNLNNIQFKEIPLV